MYKQAPDGYSIIKAIDTDIPIDSRRIQNLRLFFSKQKIHKSKMLLESFLHVGCQNQNLRPLTHPPTQFFPLHPTQFPPLHPTQFLPLHPTQLSPFQQLTLIYTNNTI